MDLAQRLKQLQTAIHQAEAAAHRPLGSVKLLAVSKGQPASRLREAFALGVQDFGENYWQEAREKQQALADLPLNWHFIGPLQSNKAKDITAHFSWVHSLAKEKAAVLLNQHRPASLPPLQVCLQINLLAEAGKSGLSLEELPEMIASLKPLTRLQLRGLMFIPPQALHQAELTQAFQRISQLKDQLNQQYHLRMDTLSMGMSEDLQEAILAGSTLVRIGRGLFGERP